MDAAEATLSLRALLQKGAFARLRRKLSDTEAHHITYAVSPAAVPPPHRPHTFTRTFHPCIAGLC